MRSSSLRTLTMEQFHHFGWHRVVIDEGQECTLSKEFFNTLLTSYFWYVTGSPFPDEDPAKSMNEILRLLDVRSEKWDTAAVVPTPPEPVTSKQFIKMPTKKRTEYVKELEASQPLTRDFQVYMEALVHEAVREHLFWRYTKESSAVSKSHCLPPVVETVEWCVQTEVERALYQGAEEHYLHLQGEMALGRTSGRTVYNRLVARKVSPVDAALLDVQALCCHPQATFTDRRALGVKRKSILQIRTELVYHSRKQLVHCSNVISSSGATVLELIEDIEDLEEQLAPKYGSPHVCC